MNERIKELAEQAGIAVWGDAVYMYDPKDTLDSTVMAKFAQLIVQEAADIAKQHVMNISTYADADFVDEQIKKHFGVEE